VEGCWLWVVCERVLNLIGANICVVGGVQNIGKKEKDKEKEKEKEGKEKKSIGIRGIRGFV
jgi:hypothetical protein